MNIDGDDLIEFREYGSSGPEVLILHGGPGAPGYMAPVARALASSFRVIEPLQRGSGATALTVARHVADLREVVVLQCHETRPAIVGHSWGAMLALAFAAEHPDRVGALVLIGCGTFDRAARERLEAARRERMDEDLLEELARLEEIHQDANERLSAIGRLFQPVDSYDPVSAKDETLCCDARAHEETWRDMMRLQEEGVYPAGFAAIKAPAIMLHGAYDPHPGRMIHESVTPLMPQVEYREWERCGHYPWLEREVRDEFLDALRSWLSNHSDATP